MSTTHFKMAAAKARARVSAMGRKLAFVPGGQAAAPQAPAPQQQAPAPQQQAPPQGDPSAQGGAPPPADPQLIVAMLDKFHEDVMTRLDALEQGAGGKKKKPSMEERMAALEAKAGVQQPADQQAAPAAEPAAQPQDGGGAQ